MFARLYRWLFPRREPGQCVDCARMGEFRTRRGWMCAEHAGEEMAFGGP